MPRPIWGALWRSALWMAGCDHLPLLLTRQCFKLKQLGNLPKIWSRHSRQRRPPYRRISRVRAKPHSRTARSRLRSALDGANPHTAEGPRALSCLCSNRMNRVGRRSSAPLPGRLRRARQVSRVRGDDLTREGALRDRGGLLVAPGWLAPWLRSLSGRYGKSSGYASLIANDLAGSKCGAARGPELLRHPRPPSPRRLDGGPLAP